MADGHKGEAVRKPTGGLVGNALKRLEEATGLTIEPKEKVELLEEVAVAYTAQERMLDLIGWTTTDHNSGREHEVKYESRRVMARRSINAWIHDPLIGGAVALMNDFVLGRGIPKPRCNDALVQERVDEAWDDPDNRRTLTDFEEQIALNTELSLVSNLLFLLFDEGEDGRVKVSTLDYLTVSEAVTDPENRHRVLWYVASEHKVKWDFKEHKWTAPDPSVTKPKMRYYEHWHNVRDAESEDRELDKPKPADMGKGRVHHVRINRTKEMIFGVPEWQRTLRWATAYNDFMKSRVDMMKAAAAFIMERKVQGTPGQVARAAQKAVSRFSPLAGSFPLDPDIDGGDVNYGYGPRPASVITSNEGVRHEALKLDSGAGNAQLDASNLRSQFSASTRWPQHYLGAGDGPGLATATAMELPVLKMIETRQEILEAIYRWFIDRVIERAVDSGHIPEELKDDEREQAPRTLEQTLEEAADQGRQFVHLGVIPPKPGDSKNHRRFLLITRDPQTLMDYYRVIVETHEDKTDDERDTKRDLGYEFGLPSPLRRMMADLVNSIANIARTFDPNNTNMALSRTLLYVGLGEGLELENATDLVDEIFPEDYVDPAVAAAQAQARLQGNVFGPEASDQPFPTGADSNAYGAPMNATKPENVKTQQSRFTVGRDGELVRWPLEEASINELPEGVRNLVRERKANDDEGWREVTDTAREELAVLTTNGSNGHGGEE